MTDAEQNVIWTAENKARDFVTALMKIPEVRRGNVLNIILDAIDPDCNMTVTGIGHYWPGGSDDEG